MLRSLTLMIAIVGAYALLRGWAGGASLLLRSCFAIATLVAGLAIWGVRRNRDGHQMVSLRRVTWVDYLSLCLIVLFAEACFVVATCTLAVPMQKWARSVAHEVDLVVPLELERSDGENDSDGKIDFGGEKDGQWLFRPNLERSLPKRSNRRPSNQPVVFVQLDDPEDATALLHSRIHLRAFCFSNFDGAVWSATKVGQSEMRTPIHFPTSMGVARVLGKHAVPHRIFHGFNPTGQNIFTALSGVTETEVSSLTQLADTIYLLPDLADPAAGYGYRAVSYPIHVSDLTGRELTPAKGGGESLEIPPQLSPQLLETAKAFHQVEGLSQQLVALRAFLQENYVYSLETKNVTNENPLLNFLYTEKRGHCEHFATAAAMLVRTLGVPSRIAYGWSGGQLYPSQNMFVFRAKDAHAWTEIHLASYGWVVFDTTPTDDAAVPEAIIMPVTQPAPDPREVIAQQSSQLSSSSPPGLSPEDLAQMQMSINPWGSVAALVVILVCALGFFFLRIWHRPKSNALGEPVFTTPPAYLIQFKQACATHGIPMPIGRTLRQQIELIESQENPPTFLTPLMDYHYGVLYGDTPANKLTEKELRREMGEW